MNLTAITDEAVRLFKTFLRFDYLLHFILI